jgi:hypothetical protein
MIFSLLKVAFRSKYNPAVFLETGVHLTFSSNSHYSVTLEITAPTLQLSKLDKAYSHEQSGEASWVITEPKKSGPREKMSRPEATSILQH